MPPFSEENQRRRLSRKPRTQQQSSGSSQGVGARGIASVERSGFPQQPEKRAGVNASDGISKLRQALSILMGRDDSKNAHSQDDNKDDNKVDGNAGDKPKQPIDNPPQSADNPQQPANSPFSQQGVNHGESPPPQPAIATTEAVTSSVLPTTTLEAAAAITTSSTIAATTIASSATTTSIATSTTVSTATNTNVAVSSPSTPQPTTVPDQQTGGRKCHRVRINSQASTATAVPSTTTSTVDVQADTSGAPPTPSGSAMTVPRIDKAKEGAIATGLLVGFFFLFAIAVFFVLRSKKDSKLRSWMAGCRRRRRPQAPVRKISNPMPLPTKDAPWENVTELPWDEKDMHRTPSFDTELGKPALLDEPRPSSLVRLRALFVNPLGSNPLTPPMTPRFQKWLKPNAMVDDGRSRASSNPYFSGVSSRLVNPSRSSTNVPANSKGSETGDQMTTFTGSSEPIPRSQQPRFSTTTTVLDVFKSSQDGKKPSLGQSRMSYFSWTTSAPLMTPDAEARTFTARVRDRESTATHVSTDSEPARFRTINSWVDQQAQKQYRRSTLNQSIEADLGEPVSPTTLPAVPPIPKAHLSMPSPPPPTMGLPKAIPKIEPTALPPMPANNLRRVPVRSRHTFDGAPPATPPPTSPLPPPPAPSSMIRFNPPKEPRQIRDSNLTTRTASTLPAFRQHPGERIDRVSRAERHRSSVLNRKLDSW